MRASGSAPRTTVTPSRWAQPRALAREATDSSASARSTESTTSASSRASQAPRASAARAYTSAVAKATSRAYRRTAAWTAAASVGSTISSTCDFDDLDAEADQIDGLPERDDAGHAARGGTEDGGRGVTGERVVVAQAEPVDEALDAGLEDLADPRPALRGELGEPRHVGEHPGHRGGAQGSGRPAQGLGGPLARAPVAAGWRGPQRTLTGRP